MQATKEEGIGRILNLEWEEGMRRKGNGMVKEDPKIHCCYDTYIMWVCTYSPQRKLLHSSPLPPLPSPPEFTPDSKAFPLYQTAVPTVMEDSLS